MNKISLLRIMLDKFPGFIEARITEVGSYEENKKYLLEVFINAD